MGVLGAAILAAEKMVDADGVGAKPERRVPARDHVGLDAHRGHEERMDDVFRRHLERDGLPARDVKFVDLALAARVLDLPHPLLADDIELHRAGGRSRGGEIDVRAPREDAEDEHQRNDDPRNFENRRVALDVPPDLSRRFAVVADHEIEDERRDERREEDGDAERREEQHVDVARHLARPRREERRIVQKGSTGLHHDGLLDPRFSRMIMTATNAPSDKRVSAPPARIAPSATRVYVPVFAS